MFQKILVGTDGSDPAKAAVEHARRLAEAVGAELVVVHSCRLPPAPDPGLGFPIPDPQPVLDAGKQILRDVERTYGRAIRTVLTQGDPAEALLVVADDEAADLIVVGNRGMKGARRLLLGNVPNRVSHHARCSVLVVGTT